MAEKPKARAPASGPSEVVAELAAAGFANARQIARGAAGVVYCCHETALGRNVAIKVLPNFIDDAGRERFLREGYAMGGLSGHPNIVNILRVGLTASGRPYIVMSYCPAGSLALRVQREGPIAWPEAVRIGVKLCGALETAHLSGTLHRDIKPANVLVNDYGEPQLTDFGTAHVAGGYETAAGLFSGTIDYLAPEVMAGDPATVGSDVYSLGATLYALIAGNAPYERRGGEDLLAHYTRINSTRVPDLRPSGIPDAVCSAIETAMSLDSAERPAAAADLGRGLQESLRRNGLKPEAMAITAVGAGSGRTVGSSTGLAKARTIAPGGPGGKTGAPAPRPPRIAKPDQRSADPESATSLINPLNDRRNTASRARPTGPPHSGPQPTYRSPSADGRGPIPAAPNTSDPTQAIAQPTSVTDAIAPSSSADPPPVARRGPAAGAVAWLSSSGKRRNRVTAPLVVVGILVAVLVLGSGVYVLLTQANRHHPAAANQPSGQTVKWQPITNARIARQAAATTQTDGTIWIFGGMGSNRALLANHEGYDPIIDSWKSGDDLPVPVQHAMAVTWRGNPIVLGGWRAAGAQKVATDQVWRVVNSHWVELPHLLQPRAAAAAAVVGDRIVVTGGIDANGALLNTVEIFDGNSWTLGTPIPTPRQMLAAASDGKLVYAVGGSNGTTDLATVEAYDPAAKSWTRLPDLPQPRGDLGVAIADRRLVAAGGQSAGQVLKSVSVLDLTTNAWTGLPDMGTARHGMAVDAVGQAVFAIGGSSEVGDGQATSSAEALQLPARRIQPVAQWRSLPDAPTPRLMTAWTVLDDKIWIMGGLRDGVAQSTVESYDPRAGAWQTQPPLPVPLHHAAAATYHGEVVVLGGASSDLTQASTKVFALRGGKWIELPSLTHPRAALAAAVVGDKLVVVGGQNAKQLVPQTEVFDGSSWHDAADMPTPREHLAAVSDGTYVYAVGGRFLSSDKNSAAFERFDPQSGAWTKLVDMPTPRGSYGAAFIDGRILAVGGEEPTRVLGVAEMYDIANGTWTALPPMPTPRHAEAVATVGNTVYCIGGANRPTHEGPVATVEALDFI
ncbi:serine/threonine-protein kinase [Mycobacterium sp. 852002-40037_SCH5390672]|uniref:serine/threonine-protein kinase n=1 Tax=Mycobacterium sp. 852002-40037_SCH5390672 TaxID=1834089 RepID=UPI000805EF31|nr:serine/threonine-protein kinase [Mycobacterium sp. 852002-40037_SCH5390672]OBB92223.1 protein kinase [Mycobacterium sp. 852002-40037_SCH5390672]